MPQLAGAFRDRPDLDVINTVASDEGVSTTILSGLAGTGKAQAAAAAQRAWAGGEIELLVWIAAMSRDAITTAYAALAADLTGVFDPEPDAGARRFLAWLDSTPARWLVVLDDLQAPSDVRGLWPPSSQSGRTLVTTRRRDSALRGHRRRLVEVGLFTPEEARSYLLTALAESPELIDDVDHLAEDLGYLPLALAQAGAYLRDQHMSSAEWTRGWPRRARSGRLRTQAARCPPRPPRTRAQRRGHRRAWSRPAVPRNSCDTSSSRASPRRQQSDARAEVLKWTHHSTTTWSRHSRPPNTSLAKLRRTAVTRLGRSSAWRLADRPRRP